MAIAIRKWVMALDEYPGWREWNHSKFLQTLHFDDELMPQPDGPEEFKFDEETEKQHAVIMCYFSIIQTSVELRDLEYYFRRFPYSGTPITRYAHLSNVCELYFGRFYQYKERLKKLFDAVKVSVPNHGVNVGKLIKLLDKEFESEMRERHSIHHRERFEDLAISRVFLLETMVQSKPELATKGWAQEYRRAYRLAANEWAKSCVAQSERLEVFTEVIADSLLNVCPFLNPD